MRLRKRRRRRRSFVSPLFAISTVVVLHDAAEIAHAYDAHIADKHVTDPLTVGLYADPNCTKSTFWSDVLRQLNDACSNTGEGTTTSFRGGATRTAASATAFHDPEAAFFTGAEEETDAELAANVLNDQEEIAEPLPTRICSSAQLHQNRIALAGFFMRNYGLNDLLNNDDACLLGAYSLFLFNIWNAWNGGSFHGTLVNFAMLNDGFLEGMTPQFYEDSAWPLKDVELRTLRAQILYNVRKYRQHFLLTNVTTTEEDGGQVYRDELKRQLSQRSRRQFADIPSWESTPFHAYTGTPIQNVPQTKVRIFVYDDGFSKEIGKLTTGASFCHRRQWGSDVGFYDFFRQAPEMTKDPEEADFFFVPGFALCLQVANLYSLDKLDEIYSKLMSDLPYLKRNNGRDHIFTFHYQDVFRSWRKFIPNAIFLTPETEVGFELSIDELGYDPLLQPVFDTRKDIVTPPYMEFKHVLGLLTFNKPLRARTIFCSFAGKLWQDVAEAYAVRNSVKEIFGAKEDCQIHAEESMSQLLNSRQMYSLMGDSRFCLVPRGRAAWSVRFFETMWAGCVPVILSDHFETPFESLFDVTKFVIKFPVAKMNELYDYLKSIPVWKLERMQYEAQRVRCWYLYTQPEISWLGSATVLHTQHQLENVCPNLGSSRNAYQATLELLGRKVRKSRSLDRFFYPVEGIAGNWAETEVVDMKSLGVVGSLNSESSALIPLSR
ncbi:unnamed protein product [Amoebophrya sp. A120]|nr:unnamed protein product [Amoebophrya sp. A120]|eukprot:GSA120T00007087001.1